MSTGSPDQACPCCKALWVKFYLTEDLTPQDKCKKAKVYEDSEGRHFWQGEDPDPDPGSSGFDVYNLETKRLEESETPTYKFTAPIDTVGIACLDESDPTTDRYRIVEMSPANALLGRLTNSLFPGSSATMQIWSGPPGEETASDSPGLTVWDWLLSGSGQFLAPNTKVVAQWINGAWYVVSAACET